VYVGKDLIIAVYVDDLTLFGLKSEIDQVKRALSERLDVKDLGTAHMLLSLHICRPSEGVITMDQIHYLDEILKEFGMEDCRGKVSPLPVGEDKEADCNVSCDQAKYGKAIGSLLYLANGTCPDVAFAVGKMASYCENPTMAYWYRVRYAYF